MIRNKLNIAVVAGGEQSEVIVSIQSAQGIVSFLDKDLFNPFIVVIEKNNWHVLLDQENHIPIDKNNFTFQLDGKIIRFDCAYITIHGIPGEDGRLQGYFEMIDMPYTSCNVLTSALTYNKYFCNQFLKNFDINIAPSIHLSRNETVNVEKIMSEIGFPCFVKPNLGGSSFGVTKVKSLNELPDAIQKAFGESDEILIERFMDGVEVTNGIYKTKKRAVMLPVTEVVPKNEFFDFEAKYKGRVEEITPARISDTLTKSIQQTSSKIYDLLNCHGIIRIDYIITKGNQINLLEVNTTPGMTPTSFIPQQIPYAGLSVKEVLTEIIEDSIERKKILNDH
ncbi:MAG: D-alanine--D-alanine ligase [Microbacter sp.]